MTAATPAPCLWCGSAAIALRSSYRGDDRHWVECYETRICGSRGPDRTTRAEAIAAWNRVAGQGWQPINTARRDGTVVIVYAPAAYDLPEIVSLCAYHPDGGWCVDELRWVTHWRPLPAPPVNPTPPCCQP